MPTFIKCKHRLIEKKIVSLQHIESMAQTDNNISDKRIRLTLRFSEGSMSFSVGDPQADDKIVFETYPVNTGISVAANLREAFKSSELLLSGYKRAMVLVDTPVMLVPMDEFHEQDVETLYKHTYKWQRNEDIVSNVLPELNVVAVFSINKDLKLVIDDHFEDIRLQPLMQSVWVHLFRRSFTGNRVKLFAYFHNKRMEVFRFQQNRFHFSNAYEANSTKNNVYYLLYIWKQLGMNIENDELYLVGDAPNKDELTTELQRFLHRVYTINPETDFHNATLSKRKDIPYDLKALYLT